MKPASPPSWAYSIRGLCGRHREGHFVDVGADIVQERLSGGDHSSAEEYDVGSIVCMRETAPTAR